MERILKDASNRIWVDMSGRILKERPFSGAVLQNNLIADFDFTPTTVTLSAGRVSQVVAANNPALIWTQSNAAIQPKFGSDGLGYYLHYDVTSGVWYLQNQAAIASLGVKNICIVTEGTTAMFAGLDSQLGYLGLPDNGYGASFFYGNNSSPQSPFYHNGVRISTTLAKSSGRHIFCGFGNIKGVGNNYSLIDGGIFLIRLGSVGDKIRRILLYGALSEAQAVYNMNALNVQYSAF